MWLVFEADVEAHFKEGNTPLSHKQIVLSLLEPSRMAFLQMYFFCLMCLSAVQQHQSLLTWHHHFLTSAH